jgi:glucan phosphoethanolaminetransferase (alkaline phosphatase superfamily)
MDITTIGIIGAIIVAVVLFFTFKNKQTASKMMEGNTDVVPLMMQKATQMKVSRLQQVTADDPKANEQLQRLVAAYKNNQISIQAYNDKLDTLIQRLEIEL